MGLLWIWSRQWRGQAEDGFLRLAGVSPGLQLVVQAPEPVTGIMEGLNAAQ